MYGSDALPDNRGKGWREERFTAGALTITESVLK